LALAPSTVAMLRQGEPTTSSPSSVSPPSCSGCA